MALQVLLFGYNLVYTVATVNFDREGFVPRDRSRPVALPDQHASKCAIDADSSWDDVVRLYKLRVSSRGAQKENCKPQGEVTSTAEAVIRH